MLKGNISSFTCNCQFAIHTSHHCCHLCFKPSVFRLWFNWDHFSTGWFLPWLGSTEANPWWGLRMTKFTKSWNIFITGDDMERVSWRSKQALDFSFLMMYAKDRGTFYVQLEDDVLTKKVRNCVELFRNLKWNFSRISYQLWNVLPWGKLRKRNPGLL